MKYEKKEDFGMIELTKEQIEEQDREEEEMKELEALDKKIKEENERYSHQSKMATLSQANSHKPSLTISNSSMNKVVKSLPVSKYDNSVQTSFYDIRDSSSVNILSELINKIGKDIDNSKDLFMLEK